MFTRSPTRRSAAVAAASVWPTTDGTATSCGPLETVRTTVAPRRASAPAGGRWRTTRPFACLANTSTDLARNPAACTRSNASATSSPTTLGTSTVFGRRATMMTTLFPGLELCPRTRGLPEHLPDLGRVDSSADIGRVAVCAQPLDGVGLTEPDHGRNAVRRRRLVVVARQEIREPDPGRDEQQQEQQPGPEQRPARRWWGVVDLRDSASAPGHALGVPTQRRGESPSTSRSGSHSSHFGRYQFRSPSSFMLTPARAENERSSRR